MQRELYADIAIPGIGDPLSYIVPQHLQDVVKRGLLVEVPVQNKRERGVVVRTYPERPPLNSLKEVLYIPDPDFCLEDDQMELAEWMSKYYVTPIGDVLRSFLPPESLSGARIKIRYRQEPAIPIHGPKLEEVLNFLRERGRKWITVRGLERALGGDCRKQVQRLAELGAIEFRLEGRKLSEKKIEGLLTADVAIPVAPNREQEKVLRSVIPLVESGRFKTFLLHGVTGSGKTAVYMWLVEKAIALGKSAIVLVPEIGLTPQVASVFHRRFGEEVVLYHSSFSAGERRWVWKALKKGEKKIVIGPRSSLFLPLRNLGIIIVDEEHDPSYKQEETAPCYNARDVAIVRGRISRVPVILGSATPSLESYYNAQKGKYILLELRRRVRGYRSPVVEIIDMREEESSSIFSIKLVESIREVLQKGGKVILFLNRRGFSPVLHCPACGYVPKCSNCSVSLVYHKRDKTLNCHLCGLSKSAPSICPECGSPFIRPLGFGTERVEEELRKLFPDVGFIRMDLDTTRARGAVDRIYSSFLRGEERIMIGTQMVTKGFDFPEVELVGVLNADISLGFPDFRAEERTFQIIMQVMGRIRRGGKCIIQTYSPDAPSIRYAVRQDYHGFVREELESRRAFDFPPFTRIASVEVRGKDRDAVLEKARKISEEFKSLCEESGVRIEGPFPPPIEKKRGFYRQRILLRSERPFAIQKVLETVSFPRDRRFRCIIDVDPLDLL